TYTQSPALFLRRFMVLIPRLSTGELLLEHTGEGNEARRARQPKVIDFRVDLDGETRAPARRLEAHFPDILARKQLAHLRHGSLNCPLRGRVFRSLLHSTQGSLNVLFVPA